MQQTFINGAPVGQQDDPRIKVVLVHERLCAEYGCPVRYFHQIDPLSELISSLLSHRTRNADSALAYRQLRQRFPTWEEVRDAPVIEVQQAISPCTWPEQKAPRLQSVLHELTQRCNGVLSLDFLQKWPVADARKWLESITGIGPKTSAAVISFSTMRGRALPVDSHHHRVAARLGLIAESLPVGPSHAVLEAQLPEDWNAQQVYDNHQMLMKHGQKVCTHRGPHCERCVVLEYCPYGQKRLARTEYSDPVV